MWCTHEYLHPCLIATARLYIYPKNGHTLPPGPYTTASSAHVSADLKFQQIQRKATTAPLGTTICTAATVTTHLHVLGALYEHAVASAVVALRHALEMLGARERECACVVPGTGPVQLVLGRALLETRSREQLVRRLFRVWLARRACGAVGTAVLKAT